jgi:hypothetical protein
VSDEPEPFVLDRVENPHPRMLAGALEARAAALATRGWPGEGSAHTRGVWLGYLRAMADATGCDPDELEAWMDRHDTTPGPVVDHPR